MKFPDLVSSIHPRWSGWIGYVLGTKKSYIIGRKEPAILVRFFEQNKLDIAWLESDELKELNAVMEVPNPSLLPKDLTMLKENTFMRKPGIWVTNGHPGNTVNDMYKWQPGAITSFYDYLQANQVFQYKANNPNVPIIIRFQHPKNWQENPVESAKNLGNEIVSKWNDIKVLNPYVYFANEMNLHYENGDENPANQWRYTTKEFYQKYADWVRMTADTVKQQVPEMKMITPPFAFGHFEDGEPENGVPRVGWAGYDYLSETIETYFDNILTFHAYWGDGNGSIKTRLYDAELSSWYAFRWKRVLELFEKRYNMQCKMIIDEAGNFAVKDTDFTDQILYFADECFKDERVIVLTYFLWLDPTKSPGNIFNSWVDNLSSEQLNVHLERMKNYNLDIVVPEPEPDPIDPEPEPEPEPDNNTMTMTVKYEKSSLPLIVGNYPKVLISISVQPPYGNSYTVISGSKPEYGNGGFEAGYAHLEGYYTLTIEGEVYKVYCKADGSKIILSFAENGNPEAMVKLESVEMTKTLANQFMALYPDIFSIVE